MEDGRSVSLCMVCDFNDSKQTLHLQDGAAWIVDRKSSASSPWGYRTLREDQSGEKRAMRNTTCRRLFACEL